RKGRAAAAAAVSVWRSPTASSSVTADGFRSRARAARGPSSAWSCPSARPALPWPRDFQIRIEHEDGKAGRSEGGFPSPLSAFLPSCSFLSVEAGADERRQALESPHAAGGNHHAPAEREHQIPRAAVLETAHAHQILPREIASARAHPFAVEAHRARKRGDER